MAAKIKSDIFNLGLYQIIGGAIGVVVILISLVDPIQFSGLIILVYAFMFSFFAYSIFCGTLCVKSGEMALRYSLINQFLQLLSFAFFGFSFSYFAGIYMIIGLDLSKSIEINLGFGISKFNVNINGDAERTEINLNLVALALIYWIEKLKKKIKDRK
jgi:hypothetical protein